MKQEKVVALILNYNDYETTNKLLKQIMNYELLEHIVVVDNCSSDKSLDNIISNDQITVLLSDRNGGYGYGNNFGIKYILSNIPCTKILILNPDVEFKESLIEELSVGLNNNYKNIVASAISYKPNKELQDILAWKLPTWIEMLLSFSVLFNKKFIRKRINYSYSELKENRFTEVDCVPGSLLMIKNDDCINNGIYDEGLFLYGEETQIGLKFKELDRKSIICSDVSYIHHHSVSINKTLNSNFKQRKLLLRSQKFILDNYYNLSWSKHFFSFFFYYYSIAEFRIYSKIKNIFNFLK